MAGTRNPFGRRPHPGSRIHLRKGARASRLFSNPKNRRQKKSWQSGSEGCARGE
jgi:hypothetical protein